jgi:hypothetical protein
MLFTGGRLAILYSFNVYQLACNMYPSSTMELWKHQAYIDNMVAQATTTLEVVIR